MFIEEHVVECTETEWNKFIKGDLVFNVASTWRNGKNLPTFVTEPPDQYIDPIMLVSEYIPFAKILSYSLIEDGMGKCNKYQIRYMPL